MKFLNPSQEKVKAGPLFFRFFVLPSLSLADIAALQLSSLTSGQELRQVATFSSRGRDGELTVNLQGYVGSEQNQLQPASSSSY